MDAPMALPISSMAAFPENDIGYSQMRMGNEPFRCIQQPLEEPFRLTKKDRPILRDDALLKEFVERAPLLSPSGAVAH